jgi:hypothetical protein
MKTLRAAAVTMFVAVLLTMTSLSFVPKAKAIEQPDTGEGCAYVKVVEQPDGTFITLCCNYDNVCTIAGGR